MNIEIYSKTSFFIFKLSFNCTVLIGVKVISCNHLKYKIDDMTLLSLDLSAKCFMKLVAIPNLSYHIRMPFQVNFK